MDSDFPADTDLAGFSIEFFVLLSNYQEVLVNKRFYISAEYGETYTYTLKGGQTEGLPSLYKGAAMKKLKLLWRIMQTKKPALR